MSGEGSGRYPRPSYEAELRAEIARLRADLNMAHAAWNAHNCNNVAEGMMKEIARVNAEVERLTKYGNSVQVVMDKGDYIKSLESRLDKAEALAHAAEQVERTWSRDEDRKALREAVAAYRERA